MSDFNSELRRLLGKTAEEQADELIKMSDDLADQLRQALYERQPKKARALHSALKARGFDVQR